MKKFIFILCFSLQTLAVDGPLHLVTVNPEIAKAVFASYSEGHYRFLQGGNLIEAYEVDESIPSCIVQASKMLLDTEAAYALEETRSLDDGDAGEIELSFETRSADPDSYFTIYCFQNGAGATIDTAREGLKSVFELN